MSPAAAGTARRLAAALAQVLARPLAAFDPGHFQLGPLPGSALARAAAAPHFAAPLNRAVARELGVAELPLGADFLDRLAARPRARLAVLLVTEPFAVVASAALHVTAAVLHRPVVAVVLGTQRAKLRSAFGDGPFEVATREALLLHAPLVSAAGTESLGALDDEGALRDALLRRGTRALRETADFAEPALGRLFALRFPPGWFDAGDASPPLTDERSDHVVKLLRRRMPAWAASIA